MIIIKIFEIIGTIAFAVSGAMVAMQKKLDLFGVVFLAIITAVGGGIFRDIIMGNVPPTAFMKPTYCFISIGAAMLTFYLYPMFIKLGLVNMKKHSNEDTTEEGKYINREQKILLRYRYKQLLVIKNIILIFDAVGLGTFTALGANIAIGKSPANLFLAVCMGLITGIGGGILRDTFVQDTPLVFKREIYAVASILGAIVFYYAKKYFSHITSFYLCFFITFGFRLISIKYKINLPIFNTEKYGVNR